MMDIFSFFKKGKHAKDAKPRKPLSKKQKKILIILISVVSVLTIILGTGIGFLIWMTSDYNYNGEVDLDEEIQNIQPIDEGIVNIALFGIDARNVKSFKGLSDSIMVLSINKGTGDIKLISIMRDSLVEIPKDTGPIYNKINGAYSRGGPTLAIKTLNKNFGLDIKEYATVNFYGMADIIDAVGGIEIEVQEKELYAKSGLNSNIKEQAKHMGISNPKLVEKGGLQTLTGIQAVAWARIRSVSTSEGVSNDYGRTDRQRVVMEKLLNKALSMKVSEFPNLIKKMLPYMETSLSYGEILELSGILSKKIEFTQTRVPQTKYVITAPKISGVGSVVYYNLEFAQKIIHAYIYDDVTQDDYLANNEIVRKGWYTGPTVSSTSSTSSKTEGNSQSSNSSSSKSEKNTSSKSGSGASSDSEDDVSSEPQENASSKPTVNTNSDTSSTDETPSDKVSSDISSVSSSSDAVVSNVSSSNIVSSEVKVSEESVSSESQVSSSSSEEKTSSVNSSSEVSVVESSETESE